ncbi:MAG: homoserine dehydrogenase [Verrucomicrobiota bacterium]
MFEALKQREANGSRIRVGLIGAGAMGIGIAWQIARTPGMELVFVADLKREALEQAVAASGGVMKEVTDFANTSRGAGEILVTDDATRLMTSENGLEFDVLVESSNTIGAAARYCLDAIARGAHVVLMNAEVDLALGPYLSSEAAKQGVVVTSDAGDQHGVLARMIDEIEMWGFQITQAGNMKGFLDRHQTAAGLIEEAAKRNLDPVQCCAYTDGTKLNVEMALLSNGRNLLPFVDGMEGPKAERVENVLDLFDFDSYGGVGRVDYVLGAEPGGGVYVVGKCDDATQIPYLKYYKLAGKGHYWLFYRPYHLCHLETTRAIALAVLYGKSVLTPNYGRVADVYAYAKSDFEAGQVIRHGIGGDEFYGLIRLVEEAERDEGSLGVPMTLLESEGGAHPKLLRPVAKDQVISSDDIEIPDTYLYRLFQAQQSLLG